MWTMIGRGALAVIAGGLLAAGQAAAASPPMPFPDVPPWHWAYQAVLKDEQAGLFIGYPTTPRELVGNSIEQVYAGFAHAGAAGARDWVERFTYNRPAGWPTPLDRSTLVAFSLTGVSSQATGDTATAAFSARVTLRNGTAEQTVTTPMRVRLQLTGGDWKVDYATLAAGSALFR